MAETSPPTGPPRLVCATCGERLVRAPRTGGFSHVARLVASCDLDGDHPALPDWELAGDLPCRVCGGATVPGPVGLRHRERARDADHPADPNLPLL